MLRTICRSKIHRATVTAANVDYPGSITLDGELMKAAGLAPYEQVHVVDVANGARLVTYCIEGASGSGTVGINGAAARLVSSGDKIIIISYAHVTPEELETFSPKVVLVDARNRIQQVVTESCRLTEDSEVDLPYRSS
ncbi:MAG: aspartate 1-decarboxylase [Candidatus Omnitrophica bacterium]|nr:aspartate 1-decarboxylase [Candidatus Omnitrophota bacterium]